MAVSILLHPCGGRGVRRLPAAGDLPMVAKTGALVFTGGMLLVASVEDILEEAHEAEKDSRASVLALVGGFALFILVSAGLAGALR